MLQNPCKTLSFKKKMVYKIPPGGEVNHIQPVAYIERTRICDGQTHDQRQGGKYRCKSYGSCTDTSSECALHMYEVSLKYLQRLSSYRADTK